MICATPIVAAIESQSTLKEFIPNSVPISYDHDPIPSKLLMECLDYILSFLTDIFKSFLASDIFRQCFKSALVTHILKMKYLDRNYLDNNRLVTILCFIAKILEKTCRIPSFFLPQLAQSLQYFSINISSCSQH